MPQQQSLALRPGFEVARNPGQSAATLINCYAERQDGKGAFPVTGYPGRTAILDRETPDRGLYRANDGTVYGVSGESLYRLNADLSATDLGTIPGTDRVEWAENLTQIAVCARGSVYTYDLAAGHFHGAVTDTTFQGASSIAGVGGWGLYVVPGLDRFFVTDINDFRSVQPLDFATSESRSDVTVAVRAVNNAPWFLGANTVEPWVRTGAAGFPFKPVGLTLDMGCVSRDAAVNFGGGLYWIGTAGQNEGLCVYRSNGYGAERVSKHPVERLLERAQQPQAARAMGWSIDGHPFLNITCDAGTAVYDPITGEWHQAGSGAWPLTGAPPPSGWKSGVYLGNRSIVADERGRIGALDFDADTDLGALMVREFATAPFGALGKKINLHEIELEMETGVGSLTENPKVILSLNRDQIEDTPREASLGLAGARRTRVRWTMLGHGRSFTARFRTTARLNVTGATARFTVLNI